MRWSRRARSQSPRAIRRPPECICVVTAGKMPLHPIIALPLAALGRVKTPKEQSRNSRRQPASADLFPELAGDDHALDLIRAVPNLMDLGLTVVAFDRIFLRIRISAEDLHGIRRRSHAHVAGEQLGVR